MADNPLTAGLPWQKSGITYFNAYAKAYGLDRPPPVNQVGQAAYGVNQKAAALQDYQTRAAAAVRAANTAAARRPTLTGENMPDYTDALLKRVQAAEIQRLGIGRTRQSTFSPLAAILSGY